MISFYSYEPKLNSFYVGVEKSAIIDGLVSGYKVIVDRTNIKRKIRSQFIDIVKTIRNLASDYLMHFNSLNEIDFIETSEKKLIEEILINETRLSTYIYSSFLKLIRYWKTRHKQLQLFTEKSSFIRKTLNELINTKIFCIYFNIPFEIALKRRTNDPLNKVRSVTQTINWEIVIKRMLKQFEPPNAAEGFDRMYIVDKNSRITVKN